MKVGLPRRLDRVVPDLETGEVQPAVERRLDRVDPEPPAEHVHLEAQHDRQEMEDGAIVRVGMERASLSVFGLPVNEDEASDWIQVDLLVGSDGSAQAVRLPE